MNDLQVKTINLTPAKVDFNFDELSAILDEQLVKYEGLEFTEKDAAACKKTITELNKGKKALDKYRKDTKKELTASVTEFENQCKELGAKFDSVINPLKDQHDQFENDRKEIKRLEIEGMIDHLVEIEGLNDKYANQLIVEDSYLTKSKTIKSIKEELTVKAEHLGIQQDKDDADREVIKAHIKLINKMCATTLREEPYLRMLEFKLVADIKSQIEDDSEKEVEEFAKQQEKYEQVPVSSTPVSKSIDEPTYVETYEVVGTEAQLEALEEFMSSKKIKWNVIE